MTDEQLSLYHEDIYEALRTAIVAMGGNKKVGSLLWAEKSPDAAGTLLANCLNTTRPEKLDPEQLLFIMGEARKIGFHVIADFIGSDTGYKFSPIEPNDEKADLQRQVVQASKLFAETVKRLERLEGLQP